MRLVMQTRIGFGIDNSFEACVASILEVPIEEVPSLWNFVVPPVTEQHHVDNWKPHANYVALYEWLKTKHSRQLVGLYEPDPITVTHAFREAEMGLWQRNFCPEAEYVVKDHEWTAYPIFIGTDKMGNIRSMLADMQNSLLLDPGQNILVTRENLGLKYVHRIEFVCPISQAPQGAAEHVCAVFWR